MAAVGLLTLIPAGFIYPNPVADYGLAVLIPLHGHWLVQHHLETVECMELLVYTTSFIIS